MCRALLYYLAQTWTADPHRQAQRDQPARAARQARHSRPSPSAPRWPGRPRTIRWRVPRRLMHPRP